MLGRKIYGWYTLDLLEEIQTYVRKWDPLWFLHGLTIQANESNKNLNLVTKKMY
jgi:hypothetical protein